MTEAIKVGFKDTEFVFMSTPQAPNMIKEIFADNYQILAKNFEFRPGDIVIDAGANEGMFSIMMGKLFPKVQFLAFEPVPETYRTLLENIKMNGLTNIIPYNLGFGGKNQTKATMIVPRDFSGGSTSWCNGFDEKTHYKVEVNLIPLDAAFELYDIKHVRLLKMDIEGAEYDVLYGATVFSKIDYLTIEVHINTKLEFEARRMDGLLNWVGKRVKLWSAVALKMAE